MNGRLSDQCRDKAAQLLASGSVTKVKIAEQCSISRTTLYEWMADDDFMAAVDHYAKKIERAILKTGIASKTNRIQAICDRWERMQRLIDARADKFKDAPGGDTGLLVERAHGHEFDAALMKSFLEHERLAAEELGQLKDVSFDNASELLTPDASLVSASLPAGALPSGAGDYLSVELSPAVQNHSRGSASVQDGNLREAQGGSVAVEVQDQAASVDESATVHRSTDTPAGEGHLLDGHQGDDPASVDSEDQ